jgi:phytoene dehydrogenase-like protein
MPGPVIVVGAGLSGLAAALRLAQAGVEVEVLESADEVGGRVRTDQVDGFRLDRGFQVFNTAYPEARRVLDLARLDLREFVPGAAVYLDGRTHRLGHPLRRPDWMWSTLTAPVGNMGEKLALALLSGVDALAPPAWLKHRADVPALSRMRQAGVRGAIVERFMRPFLSGVLLDADLETSGRVFDLIWRSFARGRLTVPAAGMGAIPLQMAARLERMPNARLRLGRRVQRVDTDSVTMSGGERRLARAVVVAVDPTAAGTLVPALPSVRMRGETTFYYVADHPPRPEPVLVLDGEQRLVINTVVMTNAAPTYGPEGSALVQASVLGARADADTEMQVRRRLSTLYGADTSRWHLLRSYPVGEALPAFPPGQALRQSVRLGPGLYVCGDHRDTPSTQGALVSGRRAADAVLTDLGIAVPGPAVAGPLLAP